MGRGGYLGGSTIIRPGSDWFSYKTPKKKKKKSAKAKAASPPKVPKPESASPTTKPPKPKKPKRPGSPNGLTKEEMARREANKSARPPNRPRGSVVHRDKEAGIVVERKGGRLRRILSPVRGK